MKSMYIVMIEVWMIIFTQMEPNVPPKLQEFLSPNCEEVLKYAVPNLEIAGITVTARCEKRQKTKEKK